MKKFIAAAFIASILAVPLLFAQSFKDGTYFAQQHAFEKSGWKYQVILTVKGGKIADAQWNAVNNLGQADKKTVAASGKYNMRSASKLKKEWNEQAAAVEAYLVKTQDINFSKYTNAAGNTDAISGASIMVKEFFVLAKEAIAAGPLPKGTYSKDGWYFASQSDFDKSGWKGNVLITVAGGSIVDAVWNGIAQDRKKKSKIAEAAKGAYGMGKIAKQGEWDIQSSRAAAHLLKVQNPTAVALKADGKTDAITGVSITVSEFYALAEEALKAAR